MLWKGRLLFKHYIPAKRARFGVEIHKWSESASSYLWNSKVYAENGSDEIPSGAPSSIGMSCGVVVDIMSDDYHVYIDNWYTSIALSATHVVKKLMLVELCVRIDLERFPLLFTKKD